MRQRTTPNTISQTGVEGSTGGDKVEVIFRNCSVLSFSRKALLILFRFILHKNTKNITTLYKGIFEVKRIEEEKEFSHMCYKSVRAEFHPA